MKRKHKHPRQVKHKLIDDIVNKETTGDRIGYIYHRIYDVFYKKVRVKINVDTWFKIQDRIRTYRAKKA